MKDEHKNTCEQVDARWRAQLGEKEEPAPEFNWKQLDDVTARPVVPLWRKVSQSPWGWAAMLALSIGLNWQSVETAQTSLPKIAAMEKKEINFSVPIIALKAPKEAMQIRPDKVLLNLSTVLADNPKEEIQVVKSEELPKSIENEEDEIILVRVDIDSIEEKSFTPVTEVAEKPVKRKQNLISQLIRQVIVGEPGGWREIANSNDKLSDGIHQVANTVIRTEQSVKQTLQIQ
jgi:hypothetical protein